MGGERNVIIFLMVNTAKSGGGFLWDQHRLNVIGSRARDWFIVIGDKDVAARGVGKGFSEATASDAFQGESLRNWLAYFQRQSRLVCSSNVSWLKAEEVHN